MCDNFLLIYVPYEDYDEKKMGTFCFGKVMKTDTIMNLPLPSEEEVCCFIKLLNKRLADKIQLIPDEHCSVNGRNAKPSSAWFQPSPAWF